MFLLFADFKKEQEHRKDSVTSALQAAVADVLLIVFSINKSKTQINIRDEPIGPILS